MSLARGSNDPTVATITRSTVSGNGQDTAPGAGGGVVVSSQVTATLRDVTLAENKSSNGLPAGGNLDVAGGGTANLVNTLIANPFGGGDCQVDGTLNAQGGNAEDNSVHSCGLESNGDNLLPPTSASWPTTAARRRRRPLRGAERHRQRHDPDLRVQRQ